MTFPAHIRRQILARDGHRCVWPGCADPTGERPPVGYKRGVEADHIVATRDGGPDTVENGRTLCCYHHELVSNEQKRRWAKAPKVEKLLAATAGDLVGVELGHKGGIVRRAEVTASELPAGIPREGPVTRLADRKSREEGGAAALDRQRPGTRIVRRHTTHAQFEAAAARGVAAGPRSALSGRTAGPGQAGISPRRHYTPAEFEAAAARREQFDDQGGFWGA